MARGTTARTRLLGVALLGLLASCGGGGEAPIDFTGTQLDPPFEVSSTPLTDTEGEPFSLTADTDKDLTLVFFGYTHCPDICGQVMATLAGTMTRLDEDVRRRIEVVFVTTDPARDTADVVASYTQSFDPTFVGLTGDLDDIIEIGRSVGVGVDSGEKLSSGGYEVTHGTQVLAIDGSDDAPVYWGAEVSQAQLTSDVLFLLDEG